MAATPNLQRKLQQTLGAEAAGDLSAWMQSMDAHRTDITELRHELRAGFARMDERFTRIDERFAKIDERFAKVDERFARVDGRFDSMQERTEKLIERALREQTRFFFLAWSVLLAAIVGLYART
jgi:predicted nuclease with TOPRIM domain